jgi:hypothetical protein
MDHHDDPGAGDDPRAGDDFSAEVSDLRLGASRTMHDAASPVTHGPAAPSPVESRLTPRQRLTRFSVTTCALLLAGVVIWSAARGSHGVAGLVPSPTVTAGPDTSQVYLLPNPPGVVVSLDGHPLASLPAPGDPHPLQLSRGPHSLVWVSKLLPFRQVECRVSVPHSELDTCPLVAPQSVARSVSSPQAPIIGLHASLSMLGPYASGLQGAIVQALGASQSSAVVQPGERYYNGQGPVVASQPLRATLAYQLLTDSGYPEPCILGDPAIPCRFPGQDCNQICTIAAAPASLAVAPNEWLAAAQVHANWTYTTLDGHPVGTSAENVGERFGVQLAVLRITWDGAQWHVTPVFGHVPGLDVADDAVCDPARTWIGNSTWSFMLVGPPPGEQSYFASDTNPTDGCVVVLEHGGPVVFLERFGLLLMVTDAAANPQDNLPIADASERALASRLMAQLHL